MANASLSKKLGWPVANVLVLLYTFIPIVLDHLAVAEERHRPSTTATTVPRSSLWTATSTSSGHSDFRARADQLDRHLPDLDLHRACSVGRWRPTRIARLDFPGKRLIVASSLLISLFPPIALVTPLFNLWREIAPVQHLARPDHPLPRPHAAAGDLDPLRVLPRDPVGDGAGGAGRRRHAAAGLPQGGRPAGRRPASSPTAIIAFFTAGTTSSSRISLDRRPTGARTVPAALRSSQGATQFSRRPGRRRRRGHRHHPGRRVRAVLPAPHRRRPHLRRGQGLKAASR